MKTALILDLETTGLSPQTDRIVEFGLILYSLQHRSVIRATSAIVDSGIGNAAEKLNHIPAELVAERGCGEYQMLETINAWIDESDVALGHNVEDFDMLFLPPTTRARRPVVDTCHDLDWPHGAPGDGLVKLALAHGLGVATAHRALADVELLARLLTRVAEMGVDLEAFVRHGLRPKATYQALVSYDDKDKAKALGFKWEAGTKRWLRRVARDDVAALPFPVREVQP